MASRYNKKTKKQWTLNEWPTCETSINYVYAHTPMFTKELDY